jgi:hypothetical protein
MENKIVEKKLFYLNIIGVMQNLRTSEMCATRFLLVSTGLYSQLGQSHGHGHGHVRKLPPVKSVPADFEKNKQLELSH